MRCFCKRGEVKCAKCDNGRIKKSRDVRGKSVKYFEDCESCRGRGWVDCAVCAGHGEVVCQTCEGTSEIITTTSFYCKIESAYKVATSGENHAFDGLLEANVLALKNLLGKPKRVNLAAESRGATEEYIFQNIPFARCVFRVGERDFEWKIYGEARNIAPSGDCVAVILQEKLEKFVAETTGAFFRFFALCRLSKEAKGFLRLPANEKILSAKRSEISRVALDCSVGEEYARSVILGTGRVAKAFVAQFFVLLLIACPHSAYALVARSRGLAWL